MDFRNETASRSEADLERANGWLRSQLQPPPEQVERVVRRAMASGRFQESGRRAAWLPAAAAAVLVLFAVSLLWWLGNPSRRAPAADAGEAGFPVAVSITNRSGGVELSLHPAPAADRAKPGILLFNSNGAVVARVTDGSPRYIVVGGST